MEWCAKSKPSMRDCMDKRTGIIYGCREWKWFKAQILLPENSLSQDVSPADPAQVTGLEAGICPTRNVEVYP